MTTTRVSLPERSLIAGSIGLGCLGLATVAAWWTTAALSLYTDLPLGDSEIARAAMVGFAVGLVLNLLFLRRWVDAAYRLPFTVLVPVYLAGSAIACAFFMGMPFGTLALGTLAGAYCGRRAALASAQAHELGRLRRATSTFTTCITTAWAVPFAVLSLREGLVQRILTTLLGWSLATATGGPGVALMLAVCGGLAMAQYLLTSLAYRFASAR